MPPLPSDVRPPKVLLKTLHHLIDNVLPLLPSSHTFLWDRTRSIRQDFTYQNYIGPEAIECNELIARIHILSLHIMLTSDVEYSKQQELEQFNKALQTLSELYTANRKIDPSFKSIREPEMRAYQLLSHLNDPEIVNEIQSLPLEIVNSPFVQLALTLRSLIQNSKKKGDISLNLFAIFFILLAQDVSIPFLFLCLLETHFQDIRVHGLESMARSYHHRGNPYPVSRLTGMLGFSREQDTVEFCTKYGLSIVNDEQAGQCVVVTGSRNHQNGVLPTKFPALYIDARQNGKSWSECIYDDDQLSVKSIPKTFVSPMALKIMKPKVFGSTSSPSNNFISNNQPKPFNPNFGSQPQNTSNASPFSSAGSVSSQKPEPIKSNSLALFGSNTSFSTTPTTHNSIFTNQSNTASTPSLSHNVVPQAAKPIFPSPVPIKSKSQTTLFGNTDTTENKNNLFQSSSSQSQAQFSSLSPSNSLKSNLSATPFSLGNSQPLPKVASTLVAPPAEKTPTITIAPQPAVPAKPKYVYKEEDLEQERNKLLKLFVQRSLREIVLPNAWSTIQAKREAEEKIKREVCETEMKHIVKSLLVEEVMNAKARQMNELRLKKMAISKFSEAAKYAMMRKEEKRRRHEEYLQITNCLGKRRSLPSMKRANGSTLLAHKSTHPTTLAQIKGNNTQSIESKIMERMKRSKEISQRLWEPFSNIGDLVSQYLEPVIKQKDHTFDKTHLKMSCFCRDWETVAGKWIATKLSLGKDFRGQRGKVVLHMEQLRDDESSYRNMTQLAFVCGLGEDGLPVEFDSYSSAQLDYDKNALAAILDKVLPNSLYKVQLLIISWSNLDRKKQLELLNIPKYHQSLSTVDFCCISEKTDYQTGNEDPEEPIDISQELFNGLKTTFEKFSAEESEFGTETKRLEELRARELEEKLMMEELEQQRQRSLESYPSLTLPDILSSENELGKRKRVVSSFNIGINGITFPSPEKHAKPTVSLVRPPQTPIQNIIPSHNSSTSINNSSSNFHSGFDKKVDIPKGILELRELVASVNKRTRYDIDGTN